jgi:hypothetical protein
VAYTIAQECRSSLLRIRSLCKQVGVYPVVDCGPVAGEDRDGHLAPCNRTRACSQDIQRLSQSYSWLTVQELRVLVEVWRAGAEWGQNDAHKCSSCNESPILRNSR